jgi:2'-5' RNA ligase superfamily
VRITKPTFIVAELPEEIATWVKLMHQELEPAIAHMPAEITLAGSSGVGHLRIGQTLEDVERILSEMLEHRLPFEACFLRVGNFPNTEIFFLEPARQPFDELHSLLANSALEFEANPFPFNPHCPLKGFTPLRPGDRERLEQLVIPAQPFMIRSVAVYENENMQPKRLLQVGRNEHPGGG